jgi:tetratricopeptide (TPR) repeat protein
LGAAGLALADPAGPRHTPATQDPAAITETARQHFQRGIAYYKEGDFKLALVEFTRSYELTKNFRILYNIGQVNQQLNNYSKAMLALERYLDDGRDEIPADRRTAVTSDLDDLRAKTAQVEVQVNVNGAEVWLDDVLVGRSPLAQALIVDAGDHRLEARRDGYRSAGRAIALAGRDSTRIELSLAKTPPLFVVSRPRPVVQQVERKTSPLVWSGWFATGALAVGAGVTGYFAVSRASNLATLRNSPTSTPEQRAAMQGQAEKFALAADIMTAATLVTAGATVYFTLRPTSSERTRSRVGTRLSLSPTGVLVTQQY